jgi:hypothetical protein
VILDLRQRAGKRASEEPLRENLANVSTFPQIGNTVTPLANFEVRARVLSGERHCRDAGARLARADAALGWGQMSDSSVLASWHILNDSR